MNEKKNPIFSLEDELMNVTIFSFKTKKINNGNVDLDDKKSKNFYKKIDLSFMNLESLKTLTIIHKTTDLSMYLKQIYSW